MRHSITLGLMVLALIVAPAPLLAQTSGGQTTVVAFQAIPCAKHDVKQVAADSQVVLKFIEAFKARQGAQILAMHGEMNRALSHAPDRLPYPEICPEGINIYIGANELGFSRAIYGAMLARGPDGSVLRQNIKGPLPYAYLALFSGWLHVEKKELAEAEKVLGKGMKNRDDIPVLASEYSNTLYLLHRPAEGLAVIEKFFADYPTVKGEERALLLRRKGYGLVELGRLDEAEAAYRESNDIEPSALVLRELDYIKNLKAKQKQ